MVGLVSDSPASRVTRDTPRALSIHQQAAAAATAWRMTTSGALHTPLEQLLLFHSMRDRAAADPASFADVAAALQGNVHIRGSPAFDEARLSPASLEQLYLRVLKDEVRSSLREAAESEKEADSNKRKRKHSTPPLQSLDDATQHTHLLPQVLERLYAQYQENVVEEIRAEEERHNRLRRDIQEIERGEWDKRLEEETKNLAQNGVASDAMAGVEKTGPQLALPEQTKAEARAASRERDAGASPMPRPPSVPQEKLERLAAGDVAAKNLSREGSQIRTPSKVQSPAPPHGFQGIAVPTGSQSASPAPAQTPFAPPERASGSPAILPSSGVVRSSGSPQAVLDHLPEIHGQPPRGIAASPSPAQGQAANKAPHAQSMQPGYGQRPPPYYGQPGHYPGYPPYGQQPMHPFPSPGQTPHSPAYSVPPYQMYPQNARPGQHPYQGQPPPMAGFHPPPPPFTGYGTPQPVFQQQFQTPLQTPGSVSSRRAGLNPLNTSVSSTRWKAMPAKAAKDGNRSPLAPPLSPFLPSSPDLSPVEDSKGSRPSSRRGADKDGPGRGRAGALSGRLAGTARGSRGTRADQRSTATPDTMAHSPAKDSTPERVSHAGRRQLKPDPSTPAAVTEEGGTSAISTPGSTARPAPARRGAARHTQSVDLGRANLKRKRAPTMEGNTPEPASVPAPPPAPTRPHHVLASRNFPKVSQSLMHEINSHKFASMFAKPITERDAPGYHDIIYAPQDLKSIRAAISAGSRAVAAAEKDAAADDGTNSPAVATPTGAPAAGAAGKGGSVWIDKTPDLVPPKGIVNGTQLEKEMFRMFTNAVMFNLDPKRGFGAMLSGGDDSDDDEDDGEKGYEVDDGGAFVRDAREMFEGVERSVRQWRSVESAAEVRPRGVPEESEGDETMAEA